MRKSSHSFIGLKSKRMTVNGAALALAIATGPVLAETTAAGGYRSGRVGG